MSAENTLKTPPTNDDLLRYPYSSGLFDALPLGIVFQNPQGEITAANPAAETMLGLTLDQMRGITSTDPRWRAIQEDGAPFPGAEHPAMVALRTGQPVADVVMGVFNPRLHGPLWIKIKAIPLRGGEPPELRGVYTVFEDITDRRLVERARENERAVIERHRWIMAMLDHLFAYVALLDTQGVVKDVNRAPLDRGGYRRDAVIGRYFPDTPWWSYDEQVQARLSAAIDQARHGETIRYDVPVSMGGDIITIDFQLSPVFAANGEIERLLATGVDITERMEAKERLRLSEDKYRSLVENTTDCIWETDQQGRFTYLSPGFQEITGYSPADFLGKVAYDIPHAEVRAQQVREEMMALVANRQRLPAIERQIQHRDGRQVSVEVRATPLFGPDGDYRGMQGITQDITARKQAELALERSHAALEQAQALTHLGSWFLDLVGNTVEWSKEVYRIHGMEPGALVNPQTHFPFIHPDDFAAFESAWQATLNGAPYDITHRIIVQGEVKWVHARAEIHCDDEGRPQSAIGTLQDVTARQQAELALTERTAALLRAEEQLREVLDTLPVGVAALDLESRRISYANECLCRMLGRERAGVVAMSPPDFFPAEHRAMNIATFEKALRGEVAWEPELPVERGDGTIFLAEIRNILAVLDGRRCLLGVFTDMTERIRQEQALRQAREAAEAANRAKSEFLAHMSHEIRTPLNVVLGLAQVLNREPLTTNQADMVGRIQEAGQSLLGIINDVLDLSKIEAGQLRLEPRPFALEELLAKLDSLLGQAARAKGLALRVERPAVAPGWVLGDGLRLEQVLFNLVGNAIKFTEAGEVVIRLEPREANATHIRLRFAVQDSGIGIAPEELTRLFDPFVQAEADISRRFGGTGLGLAISKRLEELMGGEIGGESQVGTGSTFWFELPLARATPGEVDAVPTALPTPPAGPRLTGVRVLVVDDSALNRDVVERALGLEGALTTLAADGQQAVQLLSARPSAFDAVLMDVQMPVMDGLTATQLIRSELGLTDLPVIAFTAGVLTEQQRAARDAGANDVLAKPLDLERMVAVLLHWVPAPPHGGEGLGVAAAGVPASPPPSARMGSQDLTDGFPTLPGIDRVWAARTLGGDRVFFLRLLVGFVTEFTDIVAHLRQDLAQGDRGSARRRVHSLRGSAGNLGALELMATAGDLEDALLRGETDLEAGLASLDRQVSDLSAASAPWQGATTDTAPPVGSEVPPLDAGQLEGLRVKLRGRYLSAVRDFEPLEPALRGVLGATQTAALSGAIQGLRFQEALALLDQALAGVHAGEPPEVPVS